MKNMLLGCWFALLGSVAAEAAQPILGQLKALPDPLVIPDLSRFDQAWHDLSVQSQKTPDQPIVELQDVFKLNRQATGLWSDVQSNASFEDARQRYQYRRFSRDKTENQRIRSALNDFSGNVRGFLRSTYLSAMEKESPVRVPFHPLLTQTVLEIISSMPIFPMVEPGPGVGWRVLSFFNSPETMHYYGESRAHRLHSNFQKNVVELRNALRLLTLMDNGNCVSWGLWPQASPGVMVAIQVNAHQSLWTENIGHMEYRDPDSQSAFIGDGVDMANRSLKNFKEVCRSFPNPIETMDEGLIMAHDWTQGSSESWWIDVVKAFRKFEN
jgi:hypothetical protein